MVLSDSCMKNEDKEKIQIYKLPDMVLSDSCMKKEDKEKIQIY